jgi:hypothetical protein
MGKLEERLNSTKGAVGAAEVLGDMVEVKKKLLLSTIGS